MKDSLIANAEEAIACRDQIEEREWTDYDFARFFVKQWGDDVRYLRETECLYVYFKERWHYDKTWDLLKGLYTQNMIGCLAKAIKKYNDARNTDALEIATDKLKRCQTTRDINAAAAQIRPALCGCSPAGRAAPTPAARTPRTRSTSHPRPPPKMRKNKPFH